MRAIASATPRSSSWTQTERISSVRDRREAIRSPVRRAGCRRELLGDGRPFGSRRRALASSTLAACPGAHSPRLLPRLLRCAVLREGDRCVAKREVEVIHIWLRNQASGPCAQPARPLPVRPAAGRNLPRHGSVAEVPNPNAEPWFACGCPLARCRRLASTRRSLRRDTWRVAAPLKEGVTAAPVVRSFAEAIRSTALKLASGSAWRTETVPSALLMSFTSRRFSHGIRPRCHNDALYALG